MRTLAWLKNHCIELDGKGLGYMHPHISAVEVLAIIGQVEVMTPRLSHPECDQCTGTGYVSAPEQAGGCCSCSVVGAPIKSNC